MIALRRAGEGDIPAMRAFLERHAEIAMFPLANLLNEGLAQAGADNAPRSLHAWIAAPDPVTGMVAITDEGMLLPVLPSDVAGHWDAAAPVLRDRRAIGICGAAGPARAGLARLGLSDAIGSPNRDEPHFALDLDRMEVPDMAGFIVMAPIDSDRPLLESWRRAYHAEALLTPAAQIETAARRDISNWLARDAIRVLLHEGEVVSMAGLNAEAGDIVQVGGVYTPPALRGRGLARRAVAGVLRDRQMRGARRAVLFAASDAAARAYVALGFRRIGDYTLAVFDQPREIAP